MINEAILKNAENLQNELHKFIEELNEKAKLQGKILTYNSMQTIFFLHKISELEEDIKNLKEHNITNSYNDERR